MYKDAECRYRSANKYIYIVQIYIDLSVDGPGKVWYSLVGCGGGGGGSTSM